ncbi:hypothetical protein [Luteibacter yeojuensis]|uniref:DUF4034 domain-containing protein n=1 Tax=Luteibacter yeojuensis TaxID=345309 RepID=A0A7X5QVF3_9GAMM|nr:hypothetical protein [Luteibacter yeojuensis]NID16147.1 hypothetical protein [Luteibacter yeojuensis]
MKSLFRLAVFASLFPLSSQAGDLPSLDAYKELVRFRVQDTKANEVFAGTTGEFLAQLLVVPSSPYSDLVEYPRMTNEVWWPTFIDSLPTRLPDAERSFLGLLQWQVGLSKARPGIEVAASDEAVAAYRGMQSAASALKAEVDPDIFWKARDMNGSHYAQAAGEAVALQILRDQMRRNDPATYGSRAIWPDVLSRYLEQTDPEAISNRDRNYLGGLVRQAITSMPSFGDGASRSGLPVVYRVARVAAAYADAEGYVMVGGYCTGNEPRSDLPHQWPRKAEPLCFVAANDRAVRAWYRQQLHLETISRPPEIEHSGLSRLMHWIGAALLVADFAAFIEVADSLIADDMLSEGLIEEEDAALAGERAERLTCGGNP